MCVIAVNGDGVYLMMFKRAQDQRLQNTWCTPGCSVGWEHCGPTGDRENEISGRQRTAVEELEHNTQVRLQPEKIIYEFNDEPTPEWEGKKNYAYATFYYMGQCNNRGGRSATIAERSATIK